MGDGLAEPKCFQPRKKINKSMVTRAWFITGATRGIGAEIAKAVVVDGNQVVAGDRKPEVVIKALGTYL
jgi:NAD(P)-dependent dehydrogenase (short-subunit alcohol dehydrogenase family)